MLPIGELFYVYAVGDRQKTKTDKQTNTLYFSLYENSQCKCNNVTVTYAK